MIINGILCSLFNNCLEERHCLYSIKSLNYFFCYLSLAAPLLPLAALPNHHPLLPLHLPHKLLPTQVLLVPHLNARMRARIDAALLNPHQNRLSQDREYLLHIDTRLGRCLQEGNAMLLSESQSLLKFHFPPMSTHSYSACLSLLLPTRTNVSPDRPLALASSSHLPTCTKLSRLAMSYTTTAPIALR